MQPVHENDPINIIHILDGDYFSFFTIQKHRTEALQQLVRQYQMIFIALDLTELLIVNRLVSVALETSTPYCTYSEGNIVDYQALPPYEQYQYVTVLQQAAINFAYWERHIPFLQAVADTPAEYLPYPYYQEIVDTVVQSNHVPNITKVTLPSGLAGGTRNGLVSLWVAKKLLEAGKIDHIDGWLSADYFEQDLASINALLNQQIYKQVAPNHKQRLIRLIGRAGIDPRIFLRLRDRLRPKRDNVNSGTNYGAITFYPRGNWRYYLDKTVSSRLIIDMNNRETVGRNSLDCAALGIPCISTSYSDFQFKLFPEITLSNAWDIDGAVEIANALLEDDHYYQVTIERAKKELADYCVAGFQQRINTLFDRYPQIFRL